MAPWQGARARRSVRRVAARAGPPSPSAPCSRSWWPWASERSRRWPPGALLVWVAVDSGRSARGGESGKWVFLAVASVGAVACLFLCLWLCTVLLRRVGILEDNRPRRRPTGTDLRSA